MTVHARALLSEHSDVGVFAGVRGVLEAGLQPECVPEMSGTHRGTDTGSSRIAVGPDAPHHCAASDPGAGDHDIEAVCQTPQAGP